MVQIVWHERSFNYVFRSWPGPVGSYIRRSGRKTLSLGRAMAPRRSGKLAGSLSMNLARTSGGGPEVHVGANPGAGGKKGYALYTHESAAHVIRARRAPNLVFRVDSGRVIRRKSVYWRLRNPGTTKYLTRAMRRAIG